MSKNASDFWSDNRWEGKVARVIELLHPDVPSGTVWAVIEALDALRDDIVEVIYRECSDRNTDED